LTPDRDDCMSSNKTWI